MSSNFKFQFVFPALLLLLVACGGKRSPETKADLRFSVGAVVNGVQMDGGIFMEGVRYDNENVEVESLLIDLPPDHLVSLPSGSWDMHFVGYTGPSEWSGTTYCGVLLGVNLDQPDATLNIDINQANCANEPYATLITDRATGGNSSPVLTTPQAQSTNEDILLNFNLGAGTDGESDPLTYSVVATTTNGTLSCTGGASTVCSYTPNLNFNGVDSFTYKANDGNSDSNIATVNITVNPINDAPTLASPQNESVNENDVLNFNVGIGTDVDGDTLTYTVVSTTTNGALSCTGGVSRACVYTPNTNFDGSDSFTYRTNDGALNSNTATVNITINNVQATWDNVNWDNTTWEP